MDIKKELVDDVLTVTLEGRLDSSTAPNLEEELNGALDGIKELIFKFDNLEYISSAGLRILLASQKVMAKQGEMKITGVNDEIKEIFEVTGFDEILTVE